MCLAGLKSCLGFGKKESINQPLLSKQKSSSLVAHTVKAERSLTAVTSKNSLLFAAADSPKTLKQIYIDYQATPPEREFKLRPLRHFNPAIHDARYYAHVKTVFVTQQEIVREHPIQYLPNSPFVEPIDSWEDPDFFNNPLNDNDPKIWSIHDSDIKSKEAIGITENNKHVILQQASKSCVPSCVAMLVLDNYGTPDYKAIETTNLATKDDAIAWIKKAGFNAKLSNIEKNDFKYITELLTQLLANSGPGILSILHPKLGAHVVVLDAISVSKNSATIRDSFHGRMVTMKLDTLLSWIASEHFISHDEYFIQIDGRLN